MFNIFEQWTTAGMKTTKHTLKSLCNKQHYVLVSYQSYRHENAENIPLNYFYTGICLVYFVAGSHTYIFVHKKARYLWLRVQVLEYIHIQIDRPVFKVCVKHFFICSINLHGEGVEITKSS